MTAPKVPKVDAIRTTFPRGESSLWEPDNKVFDSPPMPGVKYTPLLRLDEVVAWLEGEANESASDDFAWKVLRALADELREVK